ESEIEVAKKKEAQSFNAFQRGNDLYKKGEYEQALKEFEFVLSITPDNKYAEVFIGYCKDKITEKKIIDIEKEKIRKMKLDKEVSLVKENKQIDKLLNEKQEIQKDIQTKEINAEKRDKKNMERALKYFEEKKYTLAKKDFKKVLDGDPYRKDVVRYIKECEDQEELEKIKAKSGDKLSIKGFLDQGTKYYKKGQYEKAIEELKKAWALDPEGIELEEIQIMLEKSYEKMIGETPDVKAGDNLKIKKINDKLEEKKKIDSWLQSGKEYLEQTKYDLAQVQFEKILVVDPENVAAKKFREFALNKHKIKEEKEEEFIKAIENKAKMDDMVSKTKRSNELFEEGKQLFKDNASELALEKFKQVLALDSENEIAKDYIALCEERIAFKNQKEEETLMKMQMKELRERRKKEEETKEIEKLASKTKLINDNFEKGKTLYLNGAYKEALDLFNKVLEIDPKHKFSLEYRKLCVQNLLVEEAKEQDLLAKVKNEVKEDMVYSDIDSAGLYLKGKELMKDKKYEEAIKVFKKAWELDSEAKYIPELQKNIEQCYEAMVKIEKPQVFEGYTSVEGLYEQGKKLFAEENWSEALIVFEKIKQFAGDYKSVKMYIRVCAREVENAKLKNKLLY
ncbi:tetratricopeptide repeat protein, partial [bacterium]|nr:tetratricopeptide repeat protein [bacterium]